MTHLPKIQIIQQLLFLALTLVVTPKKRKSQINLKPTFGWYW